MSNVNEHVDLGSESERATKTPRRMSVKELSRTLTCTLIQDAERRKMMGAVERSDASVRTRRESSRLANLNESQREKRKMVQSACYGKQKVKRLKLDPAVGSNDVNIDAERFRTAFDLATQFYVCAVCGTDDSMENLRELNIECVSMVEASNLPVLYSTVMNSLRGGTSLYDEYLRNMETEFHCNGLLRDSHYICLDCAAVLKRGKIAVKKKSAHNEGPRGTMDFVGGEDDEFIEVVGVSDTSNLLNQAMNIPVNVPRTALLLGLYPGIVPEELRDLRQVEISMISIYNPVTRIKLNSKGMSFKYFHGSAHTYTVVNDVSAVAVHLPWVPSINTLAVLKYKNEVCVKELKYRPHVVRRALTWLKEHNHLYKNISIQYPEEWVALNKECELEPECMVIDEVEEKAVCGMAAISGEISAGADGSADADGEDETGK